MNKYRLPKYGGGYGCASMVAVERQQPAFFVVVASSRNRLEVSGLRLEATTTFWSSQKKILVKFRFCTDDGADHCTFFQASFDCVAFRERGRVCYQCSFVAIEF